MRQTDLELYRWKWHRDVYINKKGPRNHYSKSGCGLYWKEFGAFISIMPRQCGKTTMIGQMMRMCEEDGEKVFAIVSGPHAIKYFCNTTGAHTCDVTYSYDSNIPYLDICNTNLFLDEFTYFRSGDVDTILSNQWKSITMVGTLK